MAGEDDRRVTAPPPPRSTARGTSPRRSWGRAEAIGVGLGGEAVADAVDGDDDGVLFGAGEFLAEREDLVVDRPGGGQLVVAPYFFEHLLALDDLPAAAHEELQD